eukprot:gene41802-56435_t
MPADVAAPVMAQIDPEKVFRHCIYRDDRWFPDLGQPYTSTV